jgi:hypothetical protein
VNAKAYRSDSGSKTTIVIIVSSIGAVLAVYALLLELAVRPPPLGWLGFGILSVVVLSLGALAPLAFERTRVSAQRPAYAVDGNRRLLVIADASCSETALVEQIFVCQRGAVTVHLVVPVRVSHLHFLTDDEAEERAEAEQRMQTSVGLLQKLGVSTTGSVGTDKPLESMTDALGFFPATHVLLATPPTQESYWLERGLLAKARALTTTPVDQVTVPSAPLRGLAASGHGRSRGARARAG